MATYDGLWCLWTRNDFKDGKLIRVIGAKKKESLVGKQNITQN